MEPEYDFNHPPSGAIHSEESNCEPTLYKELNKAFTASKDREKMNRFYPSDLLGIHNGYVVQEELFTKDFDNFSKSDQDTFQNYLNNLMQLIKANNVCDAKGIGYIAKFFNILCNEQIDLSVSGKNFLSTFINTDAAVVAKAKKMSVCKYG